MVGLRAILSNGSDGECKTWQYHPEIRNIEDDYVWWWIGKDRIDYQYQLIEHRLLRFNSIFSLEFGGTFTFILAMANSSEPCKRFLCMESYSWAIICGAVTFSGGSSMTC
jgi:hypothetical protein